MKIFGVLLMMALFSGGAAAAEQEKPAAAEVKAGESSLIAIHKITKEEIGLAVTCPISGDKIKVSANTPALDLKGKTYYFSSAAAIEKFRKSPDKYMGAIKDKIKSLFKKKKS